SSWSPVTMVSSAKAWSPSLSGNGSTGAAGLPSVASSMMSGCSAGAAATTGALATGRALRGNGIGGVSSTGLTAATSTGALTVTTGAGVACLTAGTVAASSTAGPVTGAFTAGTASASE